MVAVVAQMGPQMGPKWVPNGCHIRYLPNAVLHADLPEVRAESVTRFVAILAAKRRNTLTFTLKAL